MDTQVFAVIYAGLVVDVILNENARAGQPRHHRSRRALAGVCKFLRVALSDFFHLHCFARGLGIHAVFLGVKGRAGVCFYDGNFRRFAARICSPQRPPRKGSHRHKRERARRRSIKFSKFLRGQD